MFDAYSNFLKMCWGKQHANYTLLDFLPCRSFFFQKEELEPNISQKLTQSTWASLQKEFCFLNELPSSSEDIITSQSKRKRARTQECLHQSKGCV